MLRCIISHSLHWRYIKIALQEYVGCKPNTDFGYNPKIPSTQRLLVFSILIEGALHEHG